jgi:hypothetical protein
MSPTTLLRPHLPASGSVAGTIAVLVLFFCGCTHIPGNYPPISSGPVHFSALFSGEGFRLQAGSRLPVEQVEAELGQLRSQGFSRRDPQIINSVARRKKVPPALLADQSGCAYYRFTACLDPGTTVNLTPGALVVTVETQGKDLVVHDQGYLLEDRSLPGGCRQPAGSQLALGTPEKDAPVACGFLVRLPVKGKIVGLDLVPLRCDVVRPPGVW